MKKPLKWLMLIGAVCISLTLFCKRFIPMSEEVADFVQGLGFGIIFGILVLVIIIQRRKSRGLQCTKEEI